MNKIDVKLIASSLDELFEVIGWLYFQEYSVDPYDCVDSYLKGRGKDKTIRIQVDLNALTCLQNTTSIKYEIVHEWYISDGNKVGLKPEYELGDNNEF